MSWFYSGDSKMFRANVGATLVDFVKINDCIFQRIRNEALGKEDRFMAVSILHLPESVIVEHA